MKHYKKTIIGSVLTFILGTSCCWLSSLAIWFGGVTFIGIIAKFIESVQTQLIIGSVFLGFISVYLYRQNKRRIL